LFFYTYYIQIVTQNSCLFSCLGLTTIAALSNVGWKELLLCTLICKGPKDDDEDDDKPRGIQ
jgi:hypothetical protein